MYEQNLVKTIEPIKKTTISRLNKSKKWKYGYDKEHDVVVISKTGKINEIIELQGLRVGLPLRPKSVHANKRQKWQKIKQPEELSKLIDDNNISGDCYFSSSMDFADEYGFKTWDGARKIWDQMNELRG